MLMKNNNEYEQINIGKNSSSSGIKPKLFYGSVSHNRFSSNISAIKPLEASLKFKKFFGPSDYWKIFRKQQDVLQFISEKNDFGLLPFTYQTENGDRLFLAAHPVTFWYIDEQRDTEHRHSYEIIQEFKPCKLYFDLEFDCEVNRNREGYRMVKIFINLVCAALKNKYFISCDETNILCLDSSSEIKFSCHLIFQNVNFVNNFEAGYFVKQFCYEIKSLKENLELELLRNIGAIDSIETLFVLDSKGKQKLFCDEGVYTKNRHFRLYKSSKFGKNIPLKLSPHNAFKIEDDCHVSKEEYIFLCSLITYYNKKPENLLRFEISESSKTENYKQINKYSMNTSVFSPYTDIDKCISEIIFPGRIYRSNYFPEKNIIVYDIIGNRYCRNIGREHKSNNVKYVVNVPELMYYQKCYDPECAEFRSEKKTLTVDENVFLKYNIDDDLVLKAIERYELSVAPSQTESFAESDDRKSSQHQPVLHSKFRKHSNENIYFDNNSDDKTLLIISEQCEFSNKYELPSCSTNTSSDFNDGTNVLSAFKKCEPVMEVDTFSSVDNDDNFIFLVTEQCESLVNANKTKINS